MRTKKNAIPAGEEPLWNDKDASGLRGHKIGLRWAGTIMLLLLVAVFAFQAFRPLNRTIVNEKSEKVAASPVAEFAASFVHDWFTIDESGATGRANRLKAYNPAIAPGGVSLSGETRQRVESSRIFSTTSYGKGYYTVVTQIRLSTSPVPVFVSVDAYQKGDSFAIVTKPALVPSPTLAAAPDPDPLVEDKDVELRSVLATQAEIFFAEWPKGGSLFDQILAKGSNIAPLTNGAEFEALGLVKVEALSTDAQGKVTGDPDVRTARIGVTWTMPGGASSSTTDYYVTFARQSDKWFVRDVDAGVFDPKIATVAENDGNSMSASVENTAP